MKAKFLEIVPGKADIQPVNTKYKVHYVNFDDDDYTIPLIQDIKKGDLII